jgi:hypothetical protein
LTEHLPEIVEFGFSSSTGLISESHFLCSWSFVSQPPNKTKDDRKTKLVAGLSVGACILISGLVLVWLMYTRKWCRGKEEELGLVLSMNNEFERGTGAKKFSYNELLSATNNFAEENKLY